MVLSQFCRSFLDASTCLNRDLRSWMLTYPVLVDGSSAVRMRCVYLTAIDPDLLVVPCCCSENLFCWQDLTWHPRCTPIHFLSDFRSSCMTEWMSFSPGD